MVAAVADGVPKPNWSQLPPELLGRIAEKTRDVATGVTLFRSVCPAWRAAVADAPRLLIPVPRGGGGGATPPRAGSEHAIVFPLARGWSVVVDLRDASCRLSHLATGATAALPGLNAVRETATSRVTTIGYEHFDAPAAAAPEAVTAVPVQRHRRNFLMRLRFRTAMAAMVACDYYRYRRIRRPSRWQVGMDPKWRTSLRSGRKPSPGPTAENKIHIKLDYYQFFIDTNLQFSGTIRFGVHAPSAAPSTDGMLLMMYHPMQGRTGLVFCRPGDAAWTKLDNTVIEKDDHYNYRGSSLFSFADFAYIDGKIFALDVKGSTAIFDAATLEVLDVMAVPPGTINCSTKMYGCAAMDFVNHRERRDYLHLVALPTKLLCVRVCARVHGRCSQPESFDVFELGSDSNGVAWCKVDSVDGVGGDYDLLIDGYHATFHRGGGGGDGKGNKIYYVHDLRIGASGAQAYCYSMKDGVLECVYKPPEQSDSEYSTNPSWFVP